MLEILEKLYNITYKKVNKQKLKFSVKLFLKM